MKKVDTANISLGVRKQGFPKASLDHIQEAIAESLSDLIKGLTSQTSAVVAHYGAINSGSGLNYNISAGSLYYNGEIYTIPAFVATAPGGQVPVLSIVSTPRAGDPVKFSDGNSFNVNLIRTMQWAFGTSGSGIADYLGVLRLANLLDTLLGLTTSISSVNSAISSEAATRSAADSSEAATRSAADSSEATTRGNNDTTLQNNINALGFSVYTFTTGSAGVLQTAVTIARTANKNTRYVVQMISNRLAGGSAGEGSSRQITNYVSDVSGTGTLGTPTTHDSQQNSANAPSLAIAVSGSNTLINVQPLSGVSFNCKFIVQIIEV